MPKHPPSPKFSRPYKNFLKPLPQKISEYAPGYASVSDPPLYPEYWKS